jgi:type 1 fimbria pilin
MKKNFIACLSGLAAMFAGATAFANTGTINLEGKITSGTCPIEVINPGDGSTGSTVKMGSVPASLFNAVGDEYNGKSFVLRISDPSTCGLTPGTPATATVTFNGAADGDYFAIAPGVDSATGVAINIRDKSGNPVKPGTASVAYDVHETLPTDMAFHAAYRSTAATVTPGVASTSVQFVVDII